MAALSNPDLILIFVYFAILVLIGYFASRKQDDEDYLIAKRGLGTWTSMATILASKTGAILMIFVALVYVWGLGAIWFFIGTSLGFLIFLPFALKLKDTSKGRFYTLADYFKYKYGKKVALLASLVSLIIIFLFLMNNLIAGTKIFVFFTGWAYWLCAMIMILIVLAYLLMGGFRAVVKTDVLQYIALIVILAILAIFLFKGSIVPPTDWNLFNIDPPILVGFFLIGILFPFAMPDLWRRVYSAKGKREVKQAFILSAIIYAFAAVLLALLALAIKSNFPNIDPDLALIQGFANLLPSGLLGLGVILLFAAIMSSIDTSIFTGASSIVQDFFEWDKQKTVKNMRIVIFFLAILGILFAIIMRSLIINSFIMTGFIAILGVSVIATWIKGSIKSKTLLFGFVVGLVGLFLFLFPKLLQGLEIPPTTVMVGIGLTFLGIIIGGIFSHVQRKK